MTKTERKSLQERGVEGAIHRTYYKDRVVVDFRFSDDNFRTNTENFSEKAVIDFVAKSYYKSCLTLLNQLNNYKYSDKYRLMDECSYMYLPAMFCFRHYIELKLKYLYMIYANESFNVKSHCLQDLLDELKDKGFKHNVFDEPVKYIESLENIPNSQQHSSDFYFRYLVDRDIVCQETLEIPILECKKIQQYILDIEYITEILYWNEKIRKSKNGEI